MFNKIIKYTMVLVGAIALQTHVWANDLPPTDNPPNTGEQDSNFRKEFSRQLSGSMAHLSIYGISVLLKTGGTFAAAEDFLANEKNVVLKDIQTTDAMNEFVFERESDNERFMVQVDKRKYLPPPQDWLEKTFAIETTPFGTLFSDQQQLFLFVLSEHGRHTITNF